MGLDAAQWSLVIAISSLSVGVSCVLVCWRVVIRSTRDRKWLRGLAMTKTSDVKLASITADLAELFSTLERLTTTVKRLSSRAGMRDVRERQSSNSEAPPPGASKAELRRFYGTQGKTGPEIARHQLSIVSPQLSENDE